MVIYVPCTFDIPARFTFTNLFWQQKQKRYFWIWKCATSCLSRNHILPTNYEEIYWIALPQMLKDINTRKKNAEYFVSIISRKMNDFESSTSICLLVDSNLNLLINYKK